VGRRWRIEAGRFVRGISNDILDAAGTIWAMYEDREGAYWFGTEQAGVVHYQNGTARLYTTEDGLAGNDTKVIIEDSAGGLWLGSYGGLTFQRWTLHRVDGTRWPAGQYSAGALSGQRPRVVDRHL
jgi:ligand-binding sensor domain-containing protein